VSADLTNPNLLARNIVLNLLGYGTPLLAALFSIPFIIKGLGTDRFGILTLAWVIIGYLSLLDMGLGRALTKVVAEKLGNSQAEEIPSFIWTALGMTLFLGVLISVIASGLTPVMVRDILKIPQILHAETLNTFYLLSWSVPVVIISVGFRGILEAHQRFDLINSVRIPLGIYSFTAPLAVLPFTQNLFYVVIVLVIGKLIGCVVQLYFCLDLVPALKNRIDIKSENAGLLIRFGGWMTVTNIISPLLVYLDRFFIGAILSVTAVAYYATPHEIVTKLLLISGALMGVLFPAFSSSFHSDPSRSERLLHQGMKYIFLVIFPLTLVIITFGSEGLRFWLGVIFAENSTRVLQWIASGVFMLSLGQVPYAMIQGAGRPDITATLHLIEFILYLPALVLFAMTYNIEGVAFVWMLRASVDMLCMYGLALRLLNAKLSDSKKRIIIGFIAFSFLFISSTFSGLLLKSIFFLMIFSLFVIFTWQHFLTLEEKELLMYKLFKTQKQAR